MRVENLFGAFPLLLWGWDLVGLELPLAEVRNSIDDNPGNATAKVDKLRETILKRHTSTSWSDHTHLMEKEAHETSCDDGITDP